jgi:hypothetical protein
VKGKTMITGYTCYPFLSTDSTTELPPVREVEVICWDGNELAKILFKRTYYILKTKHIVSNSKEIESVYKYKSIVEEIDVPIGEVDVPWLERFFCALSRFVSTVVEKLLKGWWKT